MSQTDTIVFLLSMDGDRGALLTLLLIDLLHTSQDELTLHLLSHVQMTSVRESREAIVAGIDVASLEHVR